MNVAQKRLKSLTTTILDPATSFLDLRNTCENLSDFFYEISGFDPALKENQLDIFTASGKAVGAETAAMCIKDIARTRTFIRGINEAIHDCLEKNPTQPVKILYAGTGPFATLLTTLTTRYSPTQLQMVLLEINPSTINYLKKVICELQMQPYIIDVVQANAVTYVVPLEYHPHILLCEAMNSGLKKEPQLEIVSNLLVQFDNPPLLIPTTVTIDACLLGNLLNYPVGILKLKTLLSLDSETAILAKKSPGSLPVLEKGINVTLPMQHDSTYSQLCLHTHVKVYKHHVISFNESSLTLPLNIMDRGESGFPSELVFYYDRGEVPGFRYEVKKN